MRGARDSSAVPQEATKPSPTDRYHTPCPLDLLLANDAARMHYYFTLPNGHQDTLTDHIHRYRDILLVILTPLALVSTMLLLMPRSPTSTRKVGPLDGAMGPKKYVVIFNAGGSRSRAHVFCFKANLDLIHIRSEIDLFVQVKNQ
jgi:hypothetical protein